MAATDHSAVATHSYSKTDRRARLQRSDQRQKEAEHKDEQQHERKEEEKAAKLRLRPLVSLGARVAELACAGHHDVVWLADAALRSANNKKAASQA